MTVKVRGDARYRWIRTASVVAVLLVASIALSACGGGASDSEIASAEKRGREFKAEKEKERKLEREIHELKREREQEKNGGASSPAAAVPTAPPSERTSCGGSLSVGPETTCPFAENVRAEYENEIGEGSGTVFAYSAANDEIYEMFCSAAPHECSGAISATVYFP